MEGWISIHRKIKENWVWEDKPFSKGQAWIDLLLSANHREGKVLFGNQIIEVPAGSFITSEVKLSKQWGWGRKKVRQFLEMLEDEKMLVKNSTTKYTTVTIVNYGLYQIQEQQKVQQRNNKGTTKEQQRNTNNNDNNDNNSSSGISKIFTFFNSNINLITPYQAEIINQFIDDGLQPELILKAMQDSLSARNKWTYLNSTLNNCLNNNILTLDKYNSQSSGKGPPKKTNEQKSNNPFLDLLKKEGQDIDTR